jgi:hypothetical protein
MIDYHTYEFRVERFHFRIKLNDNGKYSLFLNGEEINEFKIPAEAAEKVSIKRSGAEVWDTSPQNAPPDLSSWEIVH